MTLWASENIVLKVLGGSHAYGLASEDSDKDYRGVALPPVSWLVGFPPGDYGSQTFTHKRDSEDIVIHTLEKFCRLALKSNPNILELLFCRSVEIKIMTEVGKQLRELRYAFLSRSTYASFSGYAFGQLKRMRNHNTGHGAHSDLIEKYGYDTKNAMHLIRLLLMATEILRGNEPAIYRSTDRGLLLSIRNGRYTAHQVQTMAEDMDKECLALRDVSPLPNSPNRARVARFLEEVQTRWVKGDTSLLIPCVASGIY